MRTWLLMFPVIALMTGTMVEAEDHPTSVAARQAEQRFLSAVKAARKDYIADLETAAKQSLAADKLDEAIRIKQTIKDLESQQALDRGDPVVQLRRKLTNTTWRLRFGITIRKTLKHCDSVLETRPSKSTARKRVLVFGNQSNRDLSSQSSTISCSYFNSMKP